MRLFNSIETLPERLVPGLEAKSRFLYMTWREVCHVVGSLILLALAHGLFLLTGFNAPLAVFVTLAVWMTYQEFFLHPRTYHQRPWKGMLDLCFWLLPFAAYFLYSSSYY